MSKLLDKLMKSNTIKGTSVLTDSKFFNTKDMIQTIVPALNIALSGSINGGLTSGLLIIAGPSKHFKSLMALIMAKAYLDKYPDAVLVFYDNEFGTPRGYFTSLGIDTDRIIHKPLTDIEVLKQDIVPTLRGLERGDKVMVLIDSIGNIASKKEVDDAEAGKSVADMSRAKQLKSLFRMVTPYLTTMDIPMVCVNHTYMEMALFPKAIMSGGTGPMYSADNVWILGRQQDKAISGAEKGKLQGYNFVINIEKSRFVKEKSKINLLVQHNSGIDLYSNLLDIALDGQFLGQPVKGKYQIVDRETGELVGESVREKDVNKLLDLIKDLPEFDQHCRKMYQLGNNSLISNSQTSDDSDEDEEDDDE